MQAVVLAGGSKARLHSFIPDAPTPVIPFFDRPVVEHCIRLLAKHAVTDIIVATSHHAAQVLQHLGDGSRWGVKIRYCVENEPRGTAGAVKFAQSMINDTFVVLPARAVTDFDLTQALDAHRSASAVASIMLHEVDAPTEFGVVRCEDDARITRFVQKPTTAEVFANTASTGIYILEPEALSCIPHDQVYDFGRQLFPRMINNREPVYGFAIPGYWRDLGNLSSYRAAHFDALDGKLNLDLPAIRIDDGIWVGEGVDIHPSVELSSPIFLGKDVCVRRDSTLGSYTIIGSETLVEEGAHVARSSIGGGSFVGRDTRVTGCTIPTSHIVTDSETAYEHVVAAEAQYELVESHPALAGSRLRAPGELM